MRRVYAILIRSASLFLVLLLAFPAFSQERRVVTGTTSDAKGNTMPGVNVILKGTAVGTSSNAVGAFSIEAADDDILVISFIGYQSQEIRVGSQTKFEIKLEEDVSTLEEVVVVGYGEMKRADLTSAQTSVSADQIQKTLNTTIEQAIQGRSAGVYVTQNTGAPGGGISVAIRGVNSINGSNEPLYVIDGVQIQGQSNTSGSNPIAGLNPSDIQDIQILQGPSATAMFGSRATNGVVLITTKRGKAGEMKISYDFQYGVQAPPKRFEVMNTRRWKMNSML
jgi:TonB-dependent starch-binding outer membrane protein SusC